MSTIEMHCHPVQLLSFEFICCLTNSIIPTDSLFMFTLFTVSMCCFHYKCMKVNLDCFFVVKRRLEYYIFIRAQLHTVSILVVSVVNSRLRMRKTSQRRGGGGDFRLDLDREVEH